MEFGSQYGVRLTVQIWASGTEWLTVRNDCGIEFGYRIQITVQTWSNDTELLMVCSGCGMESSQRYGTLLTVHIWVNGTEWLTVRSSAKGTDWVNGAE